MKIGNNFINEMYERVVVLVGMVAKRMVAP
jgi:hypothetical protein